MAEGKPTIYIVAGPEGSGKSAMLQQNAAQREGLSPHLKGEHIGADKPLLSGAKASELLGDKSANSHAASQVVALQQARNAVAEKKSFTYETSFANRGDLNLVDQAKANGYRVVIAHVQTGSAELNVARVAERAREGGRDASPAAVRQEYQAAPKLIAEASKKADYTFVMDSSALNQPARHLATLERGRVTNSVPNAEMPGWAKEAYSQQLQAHRDSRTTPAERSFASAIDKAEQLVPRANVKVAGHEQGSSSGPVVDRSSHHLLQQTGPKDFVVHFESRLAVPVKNGQDVTLSYGANREAGKVTYNAPEASRDPEKVKAEVRDFLTQPRAQAEKNPRLAAAYSAYDALHAKAAETGPRNEQVEKGVDQAIKNSIAARLSTGKQVEVTRSSVDAVQYQVASRSLDSALQEKQLHPDRNPQINPDHRRIIVERTDAVVRSSEGRVATLEPPSAAHKEAQRMATQLAKHDGAKADSPFATREATNLYQKEQTDTMKQQQVQQQQRQQARGMDRA